MANKTKVIKSHKVSFMQLNCAKTRQAMTELEKLVQESNDIDLHILHPAVYLLERLKKNGSPKIP